MRIPARGSRSRDGSVLLVRVHGRPPANRRRRRRPGGRHSFVQLDAANAALEVPVGTGGPVAIRQGPEVLARWLFEVRGDCGGPRPGSPARPREPRAERSSSTSPPATTTASQSLQTEIHRLGEAATTKEPPIQLELPVSSRRSREIEHVTYHDLAAHIWAGEPVRMELAAADARGQVGTDAVDTVLPARRFNHPIAAAIITERKKFALELAAAELIARNLEALAAAGATYGDVPRVRDALVESASTIAGGPAPDARRRVIDQLWETAVWVEEGTFCPSRCRFP